jgi:DNA-binding transcriptional ArsR family regulator
MRRDYKLIRRLLAYFDQRTSFGHVIGLTIPDYDPDTIRYHLILLYEAGLLSCQPVYSEKGRLEDVLPFRMTWAGHEFYAAIRHDGIWKELQHEIAAYGGDLPIARVEDLARAQLAKDGK